MALGLNTNTSGADFIPHIRYDARAGRLFRVDRTQGSDGSWQNTPVDITSPPPQFLMDLAQIEIGWLSYAGGTPDLRLVRFGEALLPQPSKDHKQGFRVSGRRGRPSRASRTCRSRRSGGCSMAASARPCGRPIPTPAHPCSTGGRWTRSG